MRLYHTLWTAPLQKEKYYLTSVLHAVSFLMAKKSGAEIVLHTDTLGKELLQNIPYDKIIVDLNDINPKYKKFWAYGKMVATQNEPLNSLHFDNDVFFKNPNLINEIFNQDFDLFVQNIERDKWRVENIYEANQYLVSQNNYPGKIDTLFSYNCGLTNFRNQSLKDEYLKLYFQTVNYCVADKTMYKRENVIHQKNQPTIPDLIAEQQLLYELAHSKYNVKTLLSSNNMTIEADKLNYCHLCSNAKIIEFPNIEKFLENTKIGLYFLLQKNKDLEK